MLSADSLFLTECQRTEVTTKTRYVAIARSVVVGLQISWYALLVSVASAGPSDAPSVTAQRAVLMDPYEERLLFRKAPYENTQPGSIGKLMTAYVVFWAVDKKYVSWNNKISLSQRDTQQACTCMNPAFTIVISGVTTAATCQPGVTPLASNQKCSPNGSSAARSGESFLLRDLMKVSLNQSTGESTDAVAEHVAAAYLKSKRNPKTEKPADSDAFMNVFLGLMNQRSKALGLNSRWYTVHGGATCDFTPGCNPDCKSLGCNTSQCPTGSVCEGGGTNAMDIAKVWRALARYPLFLRMIGDRGPWVLNQQTTPPQPYGGSPFTHGYGYYPGLDGDKNGYSTLTTSPTRDCNNDSPGVSLGAPCWIAQATRAGRPLIASALQSGGFSAGQTDLAALFRYGFSYKLLPQRVVDTGAQMTELAKDHQLACSEGMCFSAYRSAEDRLKFTAWSADVDNHLLNKIGIVSDATGSNTGTPVTSFDIAYHNFAIVVGFVSDGAVKLASWQLGSGAVDPVFGTVKINFKADSGSLAGAGNTIRLLSISDDLLLSVVTDGSGALRMTTWKIDGSGKFTRLKDTGPTAQVAKELALAGAPAPVYLRLGATAPATYQVVTATTTSSDVLRLYSWSVKAIDGSISFQKSSAPVDLSEVGQNIAIATNGGGKFGTAMTQGTGASGTHEIIFWDVGADGTFARVLSSTQGNEIATETAIAPLGPAGSRPGPNISPSAFLTALQEGGHTKLISWELPRRLSEGNVADYRVSDSGPAAGPASMLRMAQIRGATPGDEKYVSALKRQDGTLILIGWSLGKTIGWPVEEQTPADPACVDNHKKLAKLQAQLQTNYGLMKTADPGFRHELAQQNAQLFKQIAALKAKLKSCSI